MLKLLILLFISSNAQAQTEVLTDTQARQDELSRLAPGVYNSVADDVYVKLYLARLVRSRLEVNEQKQRNAFFSKRFERMKKLINQRAVSLEEYEEAESQLNAGLMREEQLKARVTEMRTMFDITIDRISVGLDMPICAEIP